MGIVLRAVLACLILDSATAAGAAEAAEPPAAELGRQLIVRLGCAGCHTFADPFFAGLERPGPDLRRIAEKTDPRRALEFVTAPRELRPTTSMPHFFEEPDSEDAKNIVAYLWRRSEREAHPPPPEGDAGRGARLFAAVGCTGCHLKDAGAERRDGDEPYRLHGPNLARLGGRVDPAWLFAWLENPRRLAPTTTMPDLRLDAGEAADLTAFLIADRDPGRDAVDLAAPAEGDAEAGREAIELYGCHGCHRIDGFEDAPPQAGELASLEGFSGHGLSGLPDYGLSPRELEALRAALGGGPPPAEDALLAGRRLIARYNCRGCHLIEGRGHAIEATIDDPGMLPPNLHGEGSRVQPAWLAAYLADPGHTPLRAWLSVRMPTFGLSAGEVATAVAYFAALEERDLAVAPDAPLPARSLGLGREAFDLMPCSRCHPTGAEAARAVSGMEIEAASLAPPLGLASRRLRYEWIASWLEDPQRWQPGTRMPTFFIETRPGVVSSPFAGALGAPAFAEPRARMLLHVGSEPELEAFLADAQAVIGAIRDYVWSLAEDE